MSLFQNEERNGWLTLLFGVAGGLAAGLIGGKLISNRENREEIDGEDEADPPELVEEPAKEEESPAKNIIEPPAPEKPAPVTPKPVTALLNIATPTALINIKKPAENPSGNISVVRRSTYIVFKGSEFQLYTGDYHCILDFFDTYYFHFQGDGVTSQGVQWFKFKAKNRVTEKAEIRFKLTGSCYNKLIFQVILADSVDPSLMKNDEPEEQGPA